jgi:hypothetical protein
VILLISFTAAAATELQQSSLQAAAAELKCGQTVLLLMLLKLLLLLRLLRLQQTHRCVCCDLVRILMQSEKIL